MASPMHSKRQLALAATMVGAVATVGYLALRRDDGFGTVLSDCEAKCVRENPGRSKEEVEKRLNCMLGCYGGGSGKFSDDGVFVIR